MTASYLDPVLVFKHTPYARPNRNVLLKHTVLYARLLGRDLSQTIQVLCLALDAHGKLRMSIHDLSGMASVKYDGCMIGIRSDLSRRGT